MAVVNIALDAVPRALRALYQYIEDDLVDIIQEEVANGLQIARQITRDKGLVGIGQPDHYIDGFYVQNSPTGATLANSAPHAEALEFGAPAFFVPEGVVIRIVEWAEGKLGVDRRSANNIAQAVKRRIEANDMDPNHVIGETTEAIVQNIRRRLRRYARDHKRGKTRAAIRFRTNYNQGSRRRSAEI